MEKFLSRHRPINYITLMTRLHYACVENNYDALIELIKQGYDVNAQDRVKWTPLHYASMYGDEDIITVLVKAGANIDARTVEGSTVLHLVFEQNEYVVYEYVKLLIELGADINAMDDEKRTPLHFAVSNNHTDVVKFLLEQNVNPHIKNKNGELPIDLAKNDKIKELLTNYQYIDDIKEPDI